MSDTITLPRGEFAAYQRAVESAKDRIALLVRERDEARTEVETLRRALEQIDRHVVGACADDLGGMPEPCEECGEMREIASQALAQRKIV